MKKILSLLALSLAFFGTAKAVVVQHVELKNGSRLNGYVEQSANGLLTFHSENAVISIENANVETTEQKVNVASLEAPWVEWANKHDAFEGTGNGQTLTLNNIVLRDNVSSDSAAKGKHGFNYYLRQKRNISKVKVMEMGVNVTYLELTPNTYTLTWDDISSIKMDRRAKTDLSGINCIYQLRSGETFEGQQAGETANTLSLYLDNGVVRTFDIDDVIKYTFRGINPNQDIIAQSVLLDVVNVRNSAPIKGVIIEQNYTSDKDSENYLLIQDESNAIHSVKMSDYTGRQREENKKYAPQKDIILNVGEVLVNRTPFQMVNVKEERDVMTLDSLCRSNVISSVASGTPIAVEYNAAGAANVETYQLVQLTKTEVKKKPTVYSFSYKDLINSVTRPSSITTSVNQTTKVEYVIAKPGAYALYDAKTHRAIPIVVK